MVVIMGAIMVAEVIIMLSLIPGTGIKLIITIKPGTPPIPWPITGLKVIMEPDRQTGRLQEHPIARLQEHPIARLQEHPIVHLRGHPIVLRQERPIARLQECQIVHQEALPPVHQRQHVHLPLTMLPGRRVGEAVL